MKRKLKVQVKSVVYIEATIETELTDKELLDVARTADTGQDFFNSEEIDAKGEWWIPNFYDDQEGGAICNNDENVLWIENLQTKESGFVK